MIHVVLFCFLQGLTEFLPVSSQGHLMIYNDFFSISSNTGLSINDSTIIAHFGSLFAVVIYYRKVLVEFLYSIKLLDRPDIDKNSFLLVNLIVATLPLLIIGYFLSQVLDYNSKTLLLIIGITSIVFGIILFLADSFCLRIKSLNALSYSTSFLIGVFQCLALVPGVSRSGAVITIMRYFGFQRRFAVFYSNLLSIPAITAATFYLIIISDNSFLDNSILNFYSLIIFILSFLFSIIFIYFFVTWIRRFSFFAFASYRIIFGLGVIYIVLPQTL